MLEPQVLDFAGLVRRVGGDQEIAAEIAQLFADTLPEMLADIDAAVARGEVAPLASAVHALRGALANISAERSAEVAARIETLARRGETASAFSLVSSLRAEIEQLRDALRDAET